MTSFDPLWVPLLTHYRDDAPGRVDPARCAAHVRAITPAVRQYLVAGTTGDGWALGDDALEDWLGHLAGGAVLTDRHRFLVGAFADTTPAVIERARIVEGALADRPGAAGFVGLTLCAPREPDGGQAEIAEHFRRILAATRSPVAIYQLPQVVGCEIAPETFATLAEESDRIVLFKDTSGGDAVAAAGRATGAALLLRGAEGDYARHLKPVGRYDGWLLSTANGFAPTLRRIAEAVAAGERAEAEALSDALAGLVERLFAAAGAVEDGNPFSNANRAVDHVLAHGPAFRDVPARLVSGAALPADFLETVAGLMDKAGFGPGEGYLARQRREGQER